MADPAHEGPLERTPLHALHVARGARMVPFAGYDMPVQYPAGILKEHLHTRAAAGLFDVSHRGQVRLVGPGAAAAPRRPLGAHGRPHSRDDCGACIRRFAGDNDCAFEGLQMTVHS